jgi:hypothetical protein
MTFGTNFNMNQGGVYATEWTSVPSDIDTGVPDPTGWGTPLADFSGSCDIDEHVMNQQIESEPLILIVLQLTEYLGL